MPTFKFLVVHFSIKEGEGLGSILSWAVGVSVTHAVCVEFYR